MHTNTMIFLATKVEFSMALSYVIGSMGYLVCAYLLTHQI